MGPTAVKILLVEDSPSDADVLQEMLHQAGAGPFEFTWVQRLSDALPRLRVESFDVLLLDLSLPDSAGVETIRRARTGGMRLPVVVLTGVDDEAAGLTALREGVQDYLIKGQTDGRQIARAIRYAMERNRAEERARRHDAILAGIGRIFREALTCATEEEFGRTCLAVAEEVTQSQFGFVAETNPQTGRLDSIALSDPGWKVCRMVNPTGHRTVPTGFPIRGIYGRVLLDGKGFFTNDPPSHPDSIGTPQGHPLVKAFLGVPLIYEGKTIGMVAVGNRNGGYDAEDLTALESVAGAIVQALMRRRGEEALRQANAAKDRFIATLSHELRTPLTPALAMAGAMLKDSRLPEDLREDLAMIQRNVELEVVLINDLLDVARINTGKLTLNKQPVDAARVLRDAARICSPDLDAKSQVLTIDTPGAPYAVEADAARLHQVFWNLIKNAIKFTPTGGRIAIKASVVDRTARFTVSDSGIGIDPSMLTRLFKPFEQDERSNGLGGLGLGLAIARGVVEAHGGRISAHSEGHDKGTTFIVELPVMQGSGFRVQGPDENLNPEPRTLNPCLRILLVEDHPDTAKMMSRLLAAEGHTVTRADSVRTAVVAAQADQFDVLLSDLGLPDGTGYELMRQILAAGRTIKGIAVSGYGTAADIQKSLDAGFAEHLTKPVNFDTLHRTLIRIANGASAKAIH